MKNLEKLTNIIESIIFVSGSKIAISDIAEKLGVDEKTIKKSIDLLKEKYSKDCGIQLLTFNNKVQFCSNPNYAEDVSSVLNPIKERELSKSLLEVAAIIAYKQPVTRIDLEEIRGNSEYAVSKLLELGMIEPVGRKDAVGKPVLFGTTDEFLKRFQISSLDELPDYDELINKISLLHSNDNEGTYLYQKDEYNEQNTDEIKQENVTHNNAVNEEVAISSEKNDNDDVELIDIEDEEIPDFLKNENIDKI